MKKVKYSCVVLVVLASIGFTPSGYAQTFPVLPSPNYDVNHAALVKGTVSQDGGSGIAGILVKLKNSSGRVISNTLTDDLGQYELTAKAEADNYSLEIEYPVDGFSILTAPAAFALSGSQMVNGKDFTLVRNPNTLTVCDVYEPTLAPWGLSSAVYLNLKKPEISTAYNSVKLFTSATTREEELQVINSNGGEDARVPRLEVGATVYHEAPGSSSSINSYMEFAKSNIGGSQNLVVPASTTYTYYDISSGNTWTSGNLSDANYATNGNNVQLQIAAEATITSTINGGNVAFSVASNSNAGACLVYTYSSDPLPVRLVSFEATKQKNEPTFLEWTTAEEELSKEFQIERSSNATDWSTIGVVPTTNQGVSLAEYQYYDYENVGGTTYYRLKILDIDGSYAYSRIRSVTDGPSVNKLTLFPNPISSSQQKLQFDNLPSELQKIELVSITGMVAYSIEKPSAEGISMDGISKGFYIVNAVLQNGQVLSSRLLIN
ncbi:T9SS type A sorting domain-containing protein [Dyadobacter jejuensis]|uniref:T9SS type A sorting domain-containing protein n=1 Tax=Dyadobacter jejuensis TaxID=1082580 RepID=UPI0013047C5E|nr:T9SS type A sorting domain-containing protein [Dyadobacter jejuensis]